MRAMADRPLPRGHAGEYQTNVRIDVSERTPKRTSPEEKAEFGVPNSHRFSRLGMTAGFGMSRVV